MALEKVLAPVMVQGGLAQDTDEIALGMGQGFVLVENLKYDRAGVLKKRHGYVAVSDAVFRGLDTVPTAEVRSLHAHRGAMVAVMGLEPAEIATFTEQGWATHERACSLSMRRTPGVRLSEADLARGQAVTTGPWTVLVFQADDFLLFKQYETETGAVVQDERVLVSGGVVGFRAFAVGSDVVVVYFHSTSTEIRAFRLKTNLGSLTLVSPDLVIATTTINSLDAMASETELDTFWVTWVAVPRVGVETVKCLIGGLPLAAPTVAAGPLLHADPDAFRVGIGTHGSGRIWVAYAHFAAGTAETRLLQYTPAPFALATPMTAIVSEAASGAASRLVVSLSGWIGWDDGVKARFQLADLTGAPSGGVRTLHGCSVESRFFRRATTDWIFVADKDSRTFALVRPDQGHETPLTVAYHGAVCLDVAAGTDPPLGDVVPNGSLKYRWAALVSNGVPSPFAGTVIYNTGRRGVDLVELDFHPNQAPCVLGAEAQGCLLQGGALAPWFDGQQVVEQGFLRPPVIATFAVVAGVAGEIEGADVAPGVFNTYLYRATYEWQDERGLWHQSAPSAPTVVTVSAAQDPAKVQFTIRCLALTRRGDLPQFAGRNARISLWRTEKNSTGPYYRVDNPNLSQISNSRGSNVVGYTDNKSDATLLSSAYGRLYTDGGALENKLAPPLLAVCTWQGRVWGISGEDARQVVFSKELLPGEAPAWSPEFLFVQVEEEATAIAGLGASLLIFSRTRTYALSGLGPADTGIGADWRGPSVVSDSVGCTDARSVVVFPGGVVFLAESGFHLLASPQALPVFVGASVLQLVRDYPVCRGSAHDEANGRLLWTMARTTGQSLTLVFDYLRNAWMVWTPGGESGTRYPTALAVLGGVHWYGNGAKLLRSSADTKDDGEYFPWRLILPWARLSTVVGFQRLWRVIVALKRGGGVRLLTRLRHDDATSIAQTGQHDLSDMEAQAGGRLVVETHVAQQKGRSVQVELSEELTDPMEPTDETGGLEIYGISLEIGRKRGRTKVAQENRKLWPSLYSPSPVAPCSPVASPAPSAAAPWGAVGAPIRAPMTTTISRNSTGSRPRGTMPPRRPPAPG